MKLNQDYLDILLNLQSHHAIFAKFWSVGVLVEDTNIPTAALMFDKVGRSINFVINPSFWNSLSTYEKSFVIAHECLHAYFEHGPRMLNLIKQYNQDMHIANIAADLVVNHYLVLGFGYERSKLFFDVLATDQVPLGTNNLVWVDTIFKGKSIPTGQTLEYYFSILKQESDSFDSFDSLDQHATLPGAQEGTTQEYKNACKEIIDSITNTLSNDELKAFKDIIEDTLESKAIQAGTMAGKMAITIQLGKVIKKKKWETVIQDVLAKYKGTDQVKHIEQWAQRNRRLATVDSNLLLPSEIEIITPIYDKVDVWFFQDTSGSCSHLAKRFFAAARSIPTTRFNIRAFCFDTQVYPVNLEDGKLYGFGGTAFSIIERAIQDTMKKENVDYPQVIFIITDGYGDNVHPVYPERWHWFLTEYNSTNCIPAKSKIHQLKDFE